MRAFLALVLATIAALLAGLVGFQAGVNSNVHVDGAAVVPYAAYWGFPHFGGFLVFLLFVGLLVFAFSGRRHWGGPRGYRGWGPGFGPMTGTDDPRHQWIADAHRRLHEEEARQAGTTGTTGSAAGSSGTDRPISG